MNLFSFCEVVGVTASSLSHAPRAAEPQLCPEVFPSNEERRATEGTLEPLTSSVYSQANQSSQLTLGIRSAVRPYKAEDICDASFNGLVG